MTPAEYLAKVQALQSSLKDTIVASHAAFGPDNELASVSVELHRLKEVVDNEEKIAYLKVDDNMKSLNETITSLWPAANLSSQPDNAYVVAAMRKKVSSSSSN